MNYTQTQHPNPTNKKGATETMGLYLTPQIPPTKPNEAPTANIEETMPVHPIRPRHRAPSNTTPQNDF